MEIKILKCPACGANIEKNENISFCSYCGSKLLIDDGSHNININYKKEDVARIKEIETNKEIKLKKMQEDKISEEKGTKVLIVMTVIVFIALGVIFLGIKGGSNKQEKELQSIVNDIYIDINQENYESALIKTKTLHYTAGWSDEIEKKWDDTREALVKLIEKKMK